MSMGMRAWIALSLGLGLLAGQAGAGADATVTHGPIVGRPGTDSMGIWVRTNRPATARIRYAPEGEGRMAVSPPFRTELARDNTGWVYLEGLLPDTRYSFQVEVEGEVVPGELGSGTFRTLPSADRYRNPKWNPRGLFNFRFEFACGNNQHPAQGAGPSLPAFRTMIDRVAGDLNFAILNGDWLYEEVRDYTPEQWQAQVGSAAGQSPAVVQVAPTIVGVWENYKLYLSRGKNLAEWHRRVPSLFTFDDHELLNDVWGAGGPPGLRDRRAVFRDIGTQAWYDYLGWSNPVPFQQGIHFGKARLEAGSDLVVDEGADFGRLDLEQATNLHVHWGGPTAGVNDNALDDVGGDPNAGVYEIQGIVDRHRLRIRPPARQSGEAAYSIGRRSYFTFRLANCEFFLLDTRSERQMHDTRQPDKPGLSMLGTRQKRWLLEAMKRSDADFLFVVSSVNFMVPHVGGGAVRTSNKDDAWTVFLDEREQLIQSWDALGKPVFVLTGDLHNSFVIRITDRVWEFASGPHNSQNHITSDEGDRPANGEFQYGPRKCNIRWSTSFLPDIPREELRHPSYCVVQVNNVFDNPMAFGQPRWIAFPKPQVIFQYHEGRTGQLRYAETVSR